MEVILLKFIKNLGKAGDILKVKDGFGRNYLIPNEIAIRATDKNKQQMLSRKNELEEYNVAFKQNAEKFSKVIKHHHLIFIRKASSDTKLFGSVSKMDIVKALIPYCNFIDSSHILLTNNIKNLSIQEVNISLHPEIDQVSVIVNVARSQQEADNAFSNFKFIDDSKVIIE